MKQTTSIVAVIMVIAVLLFGFTACNNKKCHKDEKCEKTSCCKTVKCCDNCKGECTADNKCCDKCGAGDEKSCCKKDGKMMDKAHCDSTSTGAVGEKKDACCSKDSKK